VVVVERGGQKNVRDAAWAAYDHGASRRQQEVEAAARREDDGETTSQRYD